MKKNNISTLILFGSIFGLIQAADTNIWQGAESLLSKLSGIQGVLENDIIQFKQINSGLGVLSGLFDDRKNQQDDLINTVSTKLQGLTGSLSSIISAKDTLNAESLLEKRNLESQITSLLQNTTKEINSLKDAITGATNKINQLKESIATLNDLNVEKVTQAINELEQARTSYISMVTERGVLLLTLTNLLGKLGSYLTNFDSATNILGNLGSATN